MLFKEKLFLSNCDSVRQLPHDEVHKRIMLALAFSDGVVVSPNTLLDNSAIALTLKKPHVHKYLNEDGFGKVIIRGNGLAPDITLQDYYDQLPPDYIISSLPGSPIKSKIKPAQEIEIRERLGAIQQVLASIKPIYQPVDLTPKCLQNEIYRRLNDPKILGYFFKHDGDLELFKIRTSSLVSRSQWYSFLKELAFHNPQFPIDQLRLEVIDPAYHSLFVHTGEGFMQDKIKFLSGLPPSLVNATVGIKSLRKELNLISYPYKIFKIVSSFGTNELLHFLTEQAVDYIEDKALDEGYKHFDRKNWFGLYPEMRKYIGVEIK